MVTLQITLQLKPEKEKEFLELYRSEYVSAISKQEGFRETKLLKPYGNLTNFYQINIYFDSELLRVKWAASPEHDRVWPMVAALCQQVSDQGYDII